MRILIMEGHRGGEMKDHSKHTKVRVKGEKIALRCDACGWTYTGPKVPVAPRPIAGKLGK